MAYIRTHGGPGYDVLFHILLAQRGSGMPSPPASLHVVWSRLVVQTISWEVDNHQWFPRKRYIAAGITSAGAGAGGIVYPLAFGFFVGDYDFPTGVRVLLSNGAGTTLIAFILGAPCVDVPRRSIGPVFHASTWIDKRAWKSKPYVLYVIAVSLVYGGFYSLAFHVTEWADIKGFGTEDIIAGGQGERPGDSGLRTFWFLAIMNGTSIIGRLASAVFATRSAIRDHDYVYSS